MNMYAYVGNDPVNLSDPSGTSWWPSRIESVRHADGTTSWQPTAGTTGSGGLLNSNGDVRVDVANNIWWESADGSGGQWGGDIVAVAGAFFSLPSANAQATSRTCYSQGNCNIEQPNTRATVLSILNDHDVRSAMKEAFVLSMGHDSQPYRHEHGFWIYKSGTDYHAGKMIHASLKTPDQIWAGPSFGSNMFFHTHPFGAPYWGGPSGDDYGVARTRNILSLILSWDKLYWIDRR
jgi:hypothetical protein